MSLVISLPSRKTLSFILSPGTYCDTRSETPPPDPPTSCPLTLVIISPSLISALSAGEFFCTASPEDVLIYAPRFTGNL